MSFPCRDVEIRSLCVLRTLPLRPRMEEVLSQSDSARSSRRVPQTAFRAFCTSSIKAASPSPQVSIDPSLDHQHHHAEHPCQLHLLGRLHRLVVLLHHLHWPAL
ncbi:hypothetical protein EXIGLDRAFT_322012 [Exidia glandulosa HHB12029]|uniref:Uncharacterized protein n=1 Tax=Exidia glandulosa HHB12029 TaxID=1314781 RepID=A0A165LS17_EXIGL|nr:hypothetical protein EXIGLDRAFT_322012 [Exidia glandulosa HHB12029]